MQEVVGFIPAAGATVKKIFSITHHLIIYSLNIPLKKPTKQSKYIKSLCFNEKHRLSTVFISLLPLRLRQK